MLMMTKHASKHMPLWMMHAGYVYSFPFLAGHASSLLHVEDQDVQPLWRFMFSPALGPSLSFIGLPAKIVPFPMFELQARYLAR